MLKLFFENAKDLEKGICEISDILKIESVSENSCIAIEIGLSNEMNGIARIANAALTITTSIGSPSA